MNTTIHAPQRLQGESFSDYRERRHISHQIARAATHIPAGSETSRQAYRNAMRGSGAMKQRAGSFGLGLINAITRKQQADLQQKAAMKQKGCAA